MKKSSSARARRSDAAAQLQGGADGDQRRVGVADRRAVGDVAADRAGVPDLHRGEPAPHLAQVGIERSQGGHGVAVADAGADHDAVGRLVDPLQLAHAAEIDDGVEPAHLLGDPQADVGTAGDDGGARLGEERLGQSIDGGGGNEAPVAVADHQRRVVVQGVQPGQGRRRPRPRSRRRADRRRSSAAPRARSARSRCSGRDCRRARRRSPPRRAACRPCGSGRTST